MTRTGRELAIVHGPQLPAQGLLGDGEAELLPEPRDQVDQAPAHHAVDGRNGPLLDDGLQGLSVLIGEPRRGPRGPAGPEALRSPRVEAQHPIAHDLQRHAADLSRFGARGPIIDCRQSQKAPGLIGIPRALRQSAELGGIKVRAERDGNSHGDLQTGDRLRESYLCPPGNPPHESAKLRLGITARSSAGQSSSPPRHPRSCDPALTTRSPESAASRSDPGPTGASLPDRPRSDDQQPAPWLASAPHGAPAYPLFNNPGILNPSPSPGARITARSRPRPCASTATNRFTVPLRQYS